MSDERQPVGDRAFNDPDPVTVTDGDVSTSDEAMAVLHEQGVEAWQKWCADHASDDEETAVTAAAPADQPVGDGLEQGEGGDPAEPQRCQYIGRAVADLSNPTAAPSPGGTGRRPQPLPPHGGKRRDDG